MDSLKKDKLKRMKRIFDVLSNFDFENRHIKGKNNVIADVLSRNIKDEKQEEK